MSLFVGTKLVNTFVPVMLISPPPPTFSLRGLCPVCNVMWVWCGWSFYFFYVNVKVHFHITLLKRSTGVLRKSQNDAPPCRTIRVFARWNIFISYPRNSLSLTVSEREWVSSSNSKPPSRPKHLDLYISQRLSVTYTMSFQARYSPGNIFL